MKLVMTANGLQKPEMKPVIDLAKTYFDEVVLNPWGRRGTQDEIRQIVAQIRDYHAKAYDWNPTSDTDRLMQVADSSGHALRTCLRSVIEYLDQEFQYGDAVQASIGELSEGSYDETPSLDVMDTDIDEDSMS